MIQTALTPNNTSIERTRDGSIARQGQARTSFKVTRLRGGARSFAAFIPIMAAAVFILFSHQGIWPVLAMLAIGSSLFFLDAFESVKKRATLVLCAGAGVALADYLGWRTSVNDWQVWWVSMPLFLAECFGMLHTFGLLYTVWPHEEPALERSVDTDRLPIFVMIPTVNEGVEILEPTLRAALTARDNYTSAHPGTRVSIVVCNDGFAGGYAQWEEIDSLASRLGALCITRRVGGGAKAGNIENARQVVGATEDALLAIFDADQVCSPDFLLATVPKFADPSIGWVQTGQYYENLENPVARWAHDQQALFYKILCPGKAKKNAAFICGTNVVIRANALDEIGGLPQSSVTEDFAASIELHTRWRSIFVPDMLATGLGPMDLPAYFKQQKRWAIGTIGVLRTHWKEIFLPGRGGLTLSQRFQYLLACTHYLSGIRDLVYLVTPLVFAVTGISAVKGATLEAYLLHFLPYWILSLAVFGYVGYGITGLRGVAIGFASFPTLITSTIAALTRRKASFNVTSKKRVHKHGLSHLYPHIVMWILCVCGIAVSATVRKGGAHSVNILWLVYSLAMLSSSLWLGWKDCAPGFHGSMRRKTSGVLERIRRLPRIVKVCTAALCLCAGGLLVVSQYPFSKPMPVRFAAERVPGERGLIGLSVPYTHFCDWPFELDARIQSAFGIIGRTQSIDDGFDYGWAGKLAERGSIPWIVIEFGQLGANDTVPLRANPAAVANGTHDHDISRWASEIREYGKPVILTILPNTDTEWGLSSAVTRGGRPEDVARAWKRVRAIFDKAKAVNVAWAWAPRSLADAKYLAPGAESLDIAVVRLRHEDAWSSDDPEGSIESASALYPNKPILIEVKAKGYAGSKALWLDRIRAAMEKAGGRIYAFMYDEGAPDPLAHEAIAQAWSFASDPASLSAIHGIEGALDTKETSR